MKRSKFFAITQGVMWGSLIANFGYYVGDWKFYVVFLLGNIFTNLLVTRFPSTPFKSIS